MTNMNRINYNENDILGEGGFGQVFKGRFDGKDVAVKKIEIRFSINDAREEEFLKNNQHANILKFFHAERYANCISLLSFVLPICKIGLIQNTKVQCQQKSSQYTKWHVG